MAKTTGIVYSEAYISIVIVQMGNQGSQGSFTKKGDTTNNNTVNFMHSSSGQAENPNSTIKKEQMKDTDVWQTFTWNYGGNIVLLTGSFFKWKQTTALEKQGEEFKVTIQLPQGIHQYKFIVDGQWRFSPEDQIIPDANGNINNIINTTNFKKLIDKPTKTENGNKEEATDKETLQHVEEFAKCAPKLPPHYESCSYLKSQNTQNASENGSGSNGGSHHMKMEDQNSKFQQSLTESDIKELFNTSHCLPPPYHVEVDHLIRQTNKNYGAYCITQRFKNKYTTYKYFMMEKEVV